MQESALQVHEIVQKQRKVREGADQSGERAGGKGEIGINVNIQAND